MSTHYGEWWIATDELSKGGHKFLGPFESRELALTVRGYVEQVEPGRSYWVDEAKATLSPHAQPKSAETNDVKDSGGRNR